MKKFPDIFNDKVLVENATKKRVVQDRFRELAKKVFSKPHKELFAQPILEPHQSMPVHHHLIHTCPEQWMHEHDAHHKHLSMSDPHHPSLVHVAAMALHKHEKPGHVHAQHFPKLNEIKEMEENAKDSELKGLDTQVKQVESVEKEDLNNSREVNLPKSGEHSRAESDTAFEDDAPLVTEQLTNRRSVIKMTDENFDDVKSFLSRGEVSLGITLLKRLRKYRLIASTIEHDGKIVVGVAPRIEGRIKKLA